MKMTAMTRAGVARTSITITPTTHMNRAGVARTSITITPTAHMNRAGVASGEGRVKGWG